jgi:hypothetical protein
VLAALDDPDRERTLLRVCVDCSVVEMEAEPQLELEAEKLVCAVYAGLEVGESVATALEGLPDTLPVRERRMLGVCVPDANAERVTLGLPEEDTEVRGELLCDRDGAALDDDDCEREATAVREADRDAVGVLETDEEADCHSFVADSRREEAAEALEEMVADSERDTMLFAEAELEGVSAFEAVTVTEAVAPTENVGVRA